MPLKIAVAQFRSGDDPWLNLALVDDYVRAASTGGAAVVFFPENVFYRGPRTRKGFRRADIALEFLPNGRLKVSGEFSRALADYAVNWKIAVSLGSVFERPFGSGAAPTAPNAPEFYNTHLVRAPQGSWTRYRKIHLFDYQGTHARYRESAEVLAGSDVVSCELGKFRAGLSICYDLRFPELYRKLALENNCNVLAVPSAFTRETGKAHWHALLRARAIENFSYVVAAAQWGSHRNAEGQELFCYGHSLVYDPWGELVAEGSANGDELLWAELDEARVQSARARLPALYGARLFQSNVEVSSQTKESSQ